MIDAEGELVDLYIQIRKIRDTFGDDKCYEDWHKLFAMLPEGFTSPKQDIAVQLEHCERFLKCRAANIEYVPPPRWVVGNPDQPGLWIVINSNGQTYVIKCVECTSKNIIKSFGPIPEAP